MTRLVIEDVLVGDIFAMFKNDSESYCQLLGKILSIHSNNSGTQAFLQTESALL